MYIDTFTNRPLLSRDSPFSGLCRKGNYRYAFHGPGKDGVLRVSESCSSPNLSGLLGLGRVAAAVWDSLGSCLCTLGFYAYT